MEQKELYDIARDALKESELKSGDIPAIDLYVDQILNLVTEKLLQGSERYHDHRLTKTMINNYSKDGLITPVKGKKYTREQIVQMLTVYTLKSTLSIGEIKRVLQGAYAMPDFDGARLGEMYDRHIDIKEENRALAIETMEHILSRDSLDMADDLDYLTAVGALLSLSAQLKNMGQALLDARFPEPLAPEENKETEKTEKKEEKKEKKEEKKEKKEEKKEKKEESKQEKVKEKKKMIHILSLILEEEQLMFVFVYGIQIQMKLK